MDINIISRDNGSGLTRDYHILRSELEKYGHTIRFVPFDNKNVKAEKADINIFVELFEQRHTGAAKLNYMIPNQEWYEDTWRHYIPEFDLILCKTKHAEERFFQKGGKTKFISFTSQDRYNPSVKKDFKKVIHSTGRSSTKGTEIVLQCWGQNKGLPSLFVLTQKAFRPVKTGSKCFISKRRFPENAFLKAQNEYGIHICPSKSEGFGHYINEAMSAKCIVVTTDAPPMNELVTKDTGFLVPYVKEIPNHMGTNYIINQNGLSQKVKEAMNTPASRLIEMGNNAREAFLSNDNFFKEKIKEIFG